MGDRRLVMVLLVALLVATASGFGVFRYLRTEEQSRRVPTQPVVVAAQDLPEGHVLMASELQVVHLPTAAVPRDAFPIIDSVAGRVTRVPVFHGEALVPGRLAPLGSGAGLEVKIAPGKRAMAVKIDEVAGLSGLIQPNSRVDVLVTLKAGGSNERQHAKLFMSNMRVLSVGSQLERGPDGRPMNATTAALEVTPVEAEQLAVASNQGKIQLVLRGYGDPDTVATDGADTRDIMRRLDVATAEPPTRTVVRNVARPQPKPAAVAPTPMPAPAARPRSDSAVVQVFRRDKVTNQKIQKGDSTRSDSSTASQL
jgi:pilus assembly protein CpaB